VSEHGLTGYSVLVTFKSLLKINCNAQEATLKACFSYKPYPKSFRTINTP